MSASDWSYHEARRSFLFLLHAPLNSSRRSRLFGFPISPYAASLLSRPLTSPDVTPSSTATSIVVSPSGTACNKEKIMCFSINTLSIVQHVRVLYGISQDKL